MGRAAVLMPALLFAAAFGAALFFRGGTDIAFAPAFILCLAGALGCLLPALFRGFSLPCGPAALLTGGLWVYISLSLLWTTVPFVSLMTWFTLTALPLVFFGVLSAPQREKILPALAALLIAGICLVALHALVQFVPGKLVRTGGPLPNPNITAILITLALLPITALLMGRTSLPRMHTAILSCAFLLLFTGLIVTGSRAGMLGFLAGGLALLIALRPSWQRALLLALSLGALFAGFALLTATPLDDRLLAFTGAGPEAATVSERFSIWRAALALFLAHPLDGTGLGTFYLYYPAARLPGDALSAGHWAHMDPLQFGVEMGVLAPLLFYATALAFAGPAWRALKNARQNPLAAGLAAALAVLFLQAHGEFPFYAMPVLIVAGTWFAWLYVLGGGAFAGPVGWKTPEKTIAAGALVLVAGLAGYAAFSCAAGYHYLGKAQAAIAAHKPQSFTAFIDQARRAAPRTFADPGVQLAGLYIDLLTRPQALFTRDEQQQMFDDTRALLDEAQAVNPAWADIDHRRARLYQVIDPALAPDRMARIEENWRAALAKNPLHYKAREGYARFLVGQGRVAEAYDLVRDGLTRPRPAAVDRTLRDMERTLAPLARLAREQPAP